jgi:hypothetical protein
MSDIFISYASEDRDWARRLAEGFTEAGGWSVWWDREIPFGKTFDQVIWEALTNAGCIVVLWSTHAIESDWVIEEAQYGCEQRILVPVLIEKVTPPFGFRRIQAANLVSWNGNHAFPDFERLVVAINGVLNTPDRSKLQVEDLGLRIAEAVNRSSGEQLAEAEEARETITPPKREKIDGTRNLESQNVQITLSYLENSYIRGIFAGGFIVGGGICIAFISTFIVIAASKISASLTFMSVFIYSIAFYAGFFFLFIVAIKFLHFSFTDTQLRYISGVLVIILIILSVFGFNVVPIVFATGIVLPAPLVSAYLVRKFLGRKQQAG